MNGFKLFHGKIFQFRSNSELIDISVAYVRGNKKKEKEEEGEEEEKKEEKKEKVRKRFGKNFNLTTHKPRMKTTREG